MVWRKRESRVGSVEGQREKIKNGKETHLKKIVSDCVLINKKRLKHKNEKKWKK